MKRANPYEEKRQQAIKRRRFAQVLPVKDRYGGPKYGKRIRSLPANIYAGNKTELKSLDVATQTIAISSTAVLGSLNLIQVGSTFCNRIGRKISMTSIQFTGQILPLRTSPNQDYCRIMIVYDRQVNGALPAIADILQDTDQTTTNSTTPFSGINLNNRDRFSIIRDYHIHLPSLTFTAGVITNIGFIDPVAPTFNLHCYHKLGGLATQYRADSNPAVIGDISTGAIYLVVFGDVPAGSNGYELQFETRLRYTDQ